MFPPELKRSFSLLGMVGFSFSIVTCWTALGGTLILGIVSGGPPVMVWSWLGICVLSLAVAYSFAEMCSAYPTAGGQYSWVAILAPPRYARGAAWVTGWFMCTGIVAMGAVNNFVSLFSFPYHSPPFHTSAPDFSSRRSDPISSSAWPTSTTQTTKSSAGNACWSRI